jgi:hypothetical protein
LVLRCSLACLAFASGPISASTRAAHERCEREAETSARAWRFCFKGKTGTIIDLKRRTFSRYFLSGLYCGDGRKTVGFDEPSVGLGYAPDGSSNRVIDLPGRGRIADDGNADVHRPGAMLVRQLPKQIV